MKSETELGIRIRLRGEAKNTIYIQKAIEELMEIGRQSNGSISADAVTIDISREDEPLTRYRIEVIMWEPFGGPLSAEAWYKICWIRKQGEFYVDFNSMTKIITKPPAIIPPTFLGRFTKDGEKIGD